MKTTKLFFMAALALMTAACSSNDDEMTQQPAKAQGITITAQLAPKSITGTRAVELGKDAQEKDIIKASWAVGEHLAILYTKDDNQMADAEITAVDGTTGVATITFTVVDETPDNTECTIIYPLSAAKVDKTGVKDYATLLANQDGTLSANLDVRVGAGKILVSTPSLDVTTQPQAQFSIFRFGFKNLNATPVNAKNLIVSDASGNVITTVTQSPALGAMYVALPVMAAGTYWLSAIAATDNSPYIRKVKIETATSAGTFYDALVNMATLGNVICSDGSFYETQSEAETAGKTAVAIIAYVGSETGDATYKHGLAIAISNDSNGKNLSEAKTLIDNKAVVPSTKWYVPSMDQWKAMFKANGGSESNCSGLNVLANSELAGHWYWTSTEDSGNSSNAYDLYLYDSGGSVLFQSDGKNMILNVRSCLAF